MFDIEEKIVEVVFKFLMLIEMALETIFIGSICIGTTLVLLSLFGDTKVFVDLIAYCTALPLIIWFGSPVTRSELLSKFSS